MTEKYEWDIRCADLELMRLENGFTQEDFMAFSSVLHLAFQTVQNTVHVMTGRLRESGSARVERSSSEDWVGQISFGGQGVRYAASEFFGYSAKHGGYPSHAYFRRIGWQPMERAFHPNDVAANTPGSSPVRWNQAPISNTESTEGAHIEDDMMGPVTSFFSRGRRTPHPEDGGL